MLASNTFACLTLYVYLHLIVSLQDRPTPVPSSTRSLLMCGHGSLTRLPGSVCVCTVQTLRCCRVHQRFSCQLFSPFPSGETLRGPSQKGRPPPKGGRTKTEGSVNNTCRHLQHCYYGYKQFVCKSSVPSSCLLSVSENVLILSCA